MPLPENLAEHPTPAQVYEAATEHTAILYALTRHPRFSDRSADRNPGLLWVTDFIQKTYTSYIHPFLPPKIETKCKELSHPSQNADPNMTWELTWDADAGAFKDANGAPGPSFPTLPQEVASTLLADVHSRSMMARKLIFENETDMTAMMMFGGRPFDFGDEVRAAADKLPSMGD